MRNVVKSDYGSIRRFILLLLFGHFHMEYVLRWIDDSIIELNGYSLTETFFFPVHCFEKW